MGYITYVTDQRPGEPDILTGNTFADLEICDSDGHLLLKVSAPEGKRLARTVLIFTERSDQLSRATDRVPGLPANPGYAQ